MKALALLGLVFFSYVSLAQAQDSFKFRYECKLSHRFDSRISHGVWVGDCGRGSAEGYGRFSYYLKDNEPKMARETFRKYKDGQPANPYFIESDDKNGNQLFKVNSDGSLKRLDNCGKVPDSSCAAIVNYTFSRTYLTYLVTRQNIKGSYPGPRNYPGVTPNLVTSGGPTPALAAFMVGYVGKKVECNFEAINAVSKTLLDKSTNETDPCERARASGRHIYFVLTTMDLSCPTGKTTLAEDAKDQFHIYAQKAVTSVQNACGAVASVNDLPEGKVTPPPAKFLRGVVGYKVACDADAISSAVINTDQANIHESRYCYREMELTKYQYVFLTTFERSCPAGATAAADYTKKNVKAAVDKALQATITACSQ